LLPNWQTSDLLYGEFTVGLGRVGILTVNDQTFGQRESLGFRLALWDAVVQRSMATTWQARAATTILPSVARALKDKKRDVGTYLIAGLIVAYLLVVSPGTYFFLKRRNRLPAILWVQPVVVLCSLGAILLTGSLIKGHLTKVLQVTLIHQQVGEPYGFRESYLAVFSGDEADYRIASSTGELLKPVFANAEEAQPLRLNLGKGGQMEEEPTSSDSELEGLHLSLWQEGYALSAGVEELGQSISVAAGRREPTPEEESPRRLTVRNGLPYDVLFGRIRADGLEYPIPSLASGERVELPLESPLGKWWAHFRDDPGKAELARVAVRVLHSLSRSGMGLQSRPVLEAIVRRDVDDFQLDRPSSFRDPGRLTIYLLYARGEVE
jgi:hypothetical protein